MLFITLWSIVVYAPIAHWVWGGGWLAKMGALDFAGGTVVHVNAGVAALVAALVHRATQGLRAPGLPAAQRAVRAARRRAALVRLVRLQRRQRARRRSRPRRSPSRRRSWPRWGRWSSGPCSTLMRNGKATAVGAATAIVVGLVAITPAAGFISPMSAIALGAHRGVPELLRAAVARQHAAGRLARRRRRARPRRHGRRAAHRRVRREGVERRHRWPALRQPGTARDPGGRGARRRSSTAAPASFVLLKLVSVLSRCAPSKQEEGVGMDVSQHGEEAYAEGRRRHPGASGSRREGWQRGDGR